jgi:hypothetical protein
MPEKEPPASADIEEGPFGPYVELLHGYNDRGDPVVGPKILTRGMTHVSDSLGHRYLLDWELMEAVLLK